MRHHNLQVTGSINVNNIEVATKVDLSTYTASAEVKLSSLEAYTGSTDVRLDSIETISASNISRISSLESFSSSIYDTNTFTASTSERLDSIETITSSNIARIDSLETTSASVDTLNTIQNSRMDSLEAKTGSLATTGSNTFYGTQTFSGSLYIKENLIVQGSSSLQNITASAVDIGTNKIILNVDNPSVRYAGISVYDSGSTNGTGSLFWDSVNNYWLYEHPADSGAPYNSAILVSGPKNEGNLGEEVGLNTNYIMKAVGGDHISSSAIYDDGSIVAIKNTTHITGSLNIGASSYPSVNLYTTNGTNFAITNRYTDNRLSIDKIGTGELVNILGSGNVGIGATNPTRKLDIVATGEQLRLSYSGDNNAYTDFRNDSAGGLLVNTVSGYIIHYIAGSPIMRMNANGQVGIGTNPSEKFDVNGNIRSTGTSTILRLDNTAGTPQSWWVGQDIAGTYDGRFYIYNMTSSTHALTINKNNRVGIGIGTSDAYSPISVKGSNISWGETMTIYPSPSGYTTLAFRLEGADSTTGTWAIGKQSKSSESYTTEYLQFVKNGLTGGALHRADAMQIFDPANGNTSFGFKVGIGITNPGSPLQIGAVTTGAGTSSPVLIDLGSTYGTNTVGKNQKIKLWSSTNGDNYTYGIGVSSALLEITAAADASIGFYKNGTTPTELGRFTNSGAFTRPLQPAFLAYSDSGGISITGGSWYNVSNAMTVESYDIGSNYSGGTFTAPVAGRYFFYAGGWSNIGSASNGERYAWCARVNGGSQTFIVGGNYCITDSPLTGYSIVYNLAAGDYVELHAFSAVSGNWGAGTHRAFFGGYLL